MAWDRHRLPSLKHTTFTYKSAILFVYFTYVCSICGMEKRLSSSAPKTQQSQTKSDKINALYENAFCMRLNAGFSFPLLEIISVNLGGCFCLPIFPQSNSAFSFHNQKQRTMFASRFPYYRERAYAMPLQLIVIVRERKREKNMEQATRPLHNKRK